MKDWERRFFALNATGEVELVGIPPEVVLDAVSSAGWASDDSLWSPNLQIRRFVRGEDELFLFDETYFDLKVTGSEDQVREIQYLVDRRWKK